MTGAPWVRQRSKVKINLTWRMFRPDYHHQSECPGVFKRATERRPLFTTVAAALVGQLSSRPPLPRITGNEGCNCGRPVLNERKLQLCPVLFRSQNERTRESFMQHKKVEKKRKKKLLARQLFRAGYFKDVYIPAHSTGTFSSKKERKKEKRSSNFLDNHST